MKKLPLRRVILIALVAAALGYAWWLGRVAWLPRHDIVVTHNGEVANVRVYESPDGMISVQDPDYGDVYMTLSFAWPTEPTELYRGSAFRDYYFFAIPYASPRGVHIALHTKAEMDPKIRWVNSRIVEFLDPGGHSVRVTFPGYD